MWAVNFVCTLFSFVKTLSFSTLERGTTKIARAKFNIFTKVYPKSL